ncbi:hypothetical protein BH11PSE13_BH11PSE13_12470 [soil metagenome]
MTSALQKASELQADAGPEVICTVAAPRVPYSPEIYMGAELRATSPRAGAYDALRIPSLFNGRRRAPGALIEVAAVWTAPPPQRRYVDRPAPPPAPVAAVPVAVKGERRKGVNYLPREGSIPSMLLAHLHTHVGHITYTEIAKLFGLPPSSTTAVFKKALTEGVLVRHLVNNRAAMALPGYTPPPDSPSLSKEVRVLQAQLLKRIAKVTELQREVSGLQARIASATD